MDELQAQQACLLCGRSDGALEPFRGKAGEVTGRVHIDPCPKSFEEAFLQATHAVHAFKTGVERSGAVSEAILYR